MDKRCPRRTTVARILDDIVGDRRTAGADRGHPRHGQTGVAAYGYYGSWSSGNYGRRASRVDRNRRRERAGGILVSCGVGERAGRDRNRPRRSRSRRRRERRAVASTEAREAGERAAGDSDVSSGKARGRLAERERDRRDLAGPKC